MSDIEQACRDVAKKVMHGAIISGAHYKVRGQAGKPLEYLRTGNGSVELEEELRKLGWHIYSWANLTGYEITMLRQDSPDYYAHDETRQDALIFAAQKMVNADE